jgi:hypothetical protein
MAIKEVRSPISSTSKVRGGPGTPRELSPGARSAPSRRDSAPMGEARERQSFITDRTEEGPRHEPQPLPEDD